MGLRILRSAYWRADEADYQQYVSLLESPLFGWDCLKSDERRDSHWRRMHAQLT